MKIINEKHYVRLMNLIEESKVVVGGRGNKDTPQIEPSILIDISFEDDVMKEEIFGPILPILTFKDLTGVVTLLQNKSKPLALHIFSEDKVNIEYITHHIQYGGGCINDTITHLATSELGFGGVIESGIGSYHGKDGFDAFSHIKNVLDRKTFLDLPLRYQPYKEKYHKIMRFFLK